MKIKLTNTLRGKERKKKKERIDMQIQIKVDKEDLCTLKINLKGERAVGKANKG